MKNPSKEYADKKIQELEEFRDGDGYDLSIDFLRSIIRAAHSTGELEGVARIVKINNTKSNG